MSESSEGCSKAYIGISIPVYWALDFLRDLFMDEPNKNLIYTGHLAMIRGIGLADIATFGNLASGMAAVFLAIHYGNNQNPNIILLAFSFILLGLVFDIVDGPIARHRGTVSALGREMDSFSDAITLAIAPAVIAYNLGFNSIPDCIALIVFVYFCVSRLSRFNVTSDEFSYGDNLVVVVLGLPTGWSLLPTGILIYSVWQGFFDTIIHAGTVSIGSVDFHSPVLLYPVIGLFMTSAAIRFPRPFVEKDAGKGE